MKPLHIHNALLIDPAADRPVEGGLLIGSDRKSVV